MDDQRRELEDPAAAPESAVAEEASPGPDVSRRSTGKIVYKEPDPVMADGTYLRRY